MPRNGTRIAASLAAITALAILLLAPEQESGSALSRPADPATANGASPESAVRGARETPAAAPERLTEITREAAHVEFHVVGPGSVELRDASLQWEPAEPGTRAADATTPIGTSDATGIVRTRFPLAPPAGRTLLVARHVGYAARAIDVPLAAGRVEVLLEPTAFVRIRAQHRDGTPAPGVEVVLSRSAGLAQDYPAELIAQLPDPRGAHSFSGLTDADGTLEIHGVAADRYFVAACAKYRLVLRSDAEEATIDVPSTGEIEVCFRTTPIYAAVARVAQDRVMGMSHEEVVVREAQQHRIEPQLQRCRQALLERFPEALVVATTEARALQMGYEQRVEARLEHAGAQALTLLLYIAEELEQPQIIELAPQSAKPVVEGRLRFRILDAAERELDGVPLAFRGTGFLARCSSGAEAVLPAGRYEHPTVPNQPWLQDQLQGSRFEVEAESTRELVARLPASAMALRLQLARRDGAPVRGARVLLLCGNGYRAEISARGEPVLVWLPRGAVEGSVECSGCARASFTVAAPEEGDPELRSIELAPR